MDFFYTMAISKLLKGELNLNTVDIRFLALKFTAEPNRDDDDIAKVISGSEEISVTGYSRFTLGEKEVVLDDVKDRVKLSPKQKFVTFGTLADGQTLRYVIMYAFDTDDSQSIPICCFDVGPIETNNTELQFNINADGLFEVISESGQA